MSPTAIRKPMPVQAWLSSTQMPRKYLPSRSMAMKTR
jgi:hypothetical protein